MNEMMTTDAEVSAIVPEIWSSKWYEVLLAELPFEGSISRDWEGEIKNLGDTVHIPTMPEFDEATEAGETEAVEADSLTVTTQPLVINRRVVKDFIVTNKALLQSVAFVDKLRAMALHSIQKKIQSIIISLTVPNAAGPDHSVAYDSGTTLALADILEVKELLDTQNVPLAGRVCIFGAAQMNDIFNIVGFTSSDFVAGVNPLTSGDLPQRLLGFVPKFTTIVGNTSYWFHPSFMTIAAQQGMVVSEHDLGVQGIRAKRVNCDTLIGVKQLDGLRVATLG